MSAKSRLVSIRLEAVPNLKQSAISYILIALRDPNVGIKQDRKDFLLIKPKPGVELDKVIDTKLHTAIISFS